MHRRDSMETFQCTVCKTEQPTENFHKHKANKRGFRSSCKSCIAQYDDKRYEIKKDAILAYSKKYRNENPEKTSEIRKKSYRKHHAQRRSHYYEVKYGITLIQKQQMYEEQNHYCACCKENFELKDLCVDHNHTTGKIRGLLCNPCNTGLGLLKENKEILLNAIVYLTERN